MNAKKVRSADPSNPVPADVVGILESVIEERDSAMAKWGIQNHPDGTGGVPAEMLRDAAIADTNDAAEAGATTWKLILMEEVREAFAETDLAALDAELNQVMQVCCVWREDLRRRMNLAHDNRVAEALEAKSNEPKPVSQVHTEKELASARAARALEDDRN